MQKVVRKVMDPGLHPTARGTQALPCIACVCVCVYGNMKLKYALLYKWHKAVHSLMKLATFLSAS